MRDLPSPVQINITGFGAGWRERVCVRGGRGSRGAKELASITAADDGNPCDCFKRRAAVKSEALEDILGSKQKPRRFCSWELCLITLCVQTKSFQNFHTKPLLRGFGAVLLFKFFKTLGCR